jgi:hypothetical protein
MLAGGSMREGLQLLTGAPSDRVNINVPDDEDDDNSDLLWAKLVSACEAKLVLRYLFLFLLIFVFRHMSRMKGAVFYLNR